jgi:hypothetical protein
MVIPGSFDPKLTLPSVSNGYLISFSRHNPKVHLHSLATGGSFVAPFSLPGATNIVLQDAAVTADGSILVVGTYSPKAGGASANFVSVMDQGGRVQSTYDLGDYTPSRVCSAPDGTFWTLGQSWPSESARPRGDYRMLRNYTPGGALKQAYFSRSSAVSVPMDLRPAGRTFGQDVTPAFLACGTTSVGALVGNRGSQLWVEVSLQTGIAQQWSVTASPGRIAGLALLSQNAVYASVARPNDSRTKLVQYRLAFANDGSAVWTQVPKNPANVSIGRLVGTDSAKLVVLHQTSDHQPQLFWNQP